MTTKTKKNFARKAKQNDSNGHDDDEKKIEPVKNSTLDDQERSLKFPAIINLCREADAAERHVGDFLWRVGDALIAECGLPGRHGVNTGTKDKLNKVAIELKQAGLGQWSLIYLRKLRATAAAFKDDNRLSSLPWTVHLAAGKPDTLSKITKLAKAKGEPLTVAVAKKLKKQIDADSRPRPSNDKGKAAIVEELCRREAADIERRITDVSEKLQRVLGRVEPHNAADMAGRWDAVVLKAQNLAAVLRDRATVRQEAAE